MTNKEYMDLLEKYHDSPVKIHIEYDNDAEPVIRHTITTFDFVKKDQKKNILGWTLTQSELNVIELVNGELCMPVPNIMDSMIETGLTSSEYLKLVKDNAALYRIGSNRLANSYTAHLIRLPYYEDEAECFQRELIGEMVLYHSHVKYVKKIIENAKKDFLSIHDRILGRN